MIPRAWDCAKNVGRRTLAFMAGVDEEEGKEERDEKEGDAISPRFEKMYLVIYGAYGGLCSFDPDCLTAIVKIFMLNIIDALC